MRALKHSVLSFLALFTFLAAQKISKLILKIREKTGGSNKSKKKWPWRFKVFNSQVQLFFKTSSPGLLKSVTNPKSSDLTKEELKNQCYHDKDCMHHRTTILFLKGKINYVLIDFHLKTFISIYSQRKENWLHTWYKYQICWISTNLATESPPDSHST